MLPGKHLKTHNSSQSRIQNCNHQRKQNKEYIFEITGQDAGELGQYQLMKN